ncbi:MAG: hypothetical protein U9Q22_06510 [Candidatus Altiarchaeota archaeon]|nr:hypothetical protein [Candidatus Altiarchaeota archaeon]
MSERQNFVLQDKAILYPTVKKLLIYVLVFTLLLTSFVFAEKRGTPKAGGLDVPPSVENDNNGKGKPEKMQTTQPDIRRDMTKEEKKLAVEEIRNKVLEKKQMLELRLQNISNRDKQKIFRNQNRVREAVMTLLALRNVTNMTGIGKNISVIARGFNNSVSKTIKAEEAIQNRGGITRFLFGGDEKAAATIQAELNNNRVMLKKLEKLKMMYDPEFQSLIDEKIGLIKLEQNRVMQLVEKEKGGLIPVYMLFSQYFYRG